MAERQRVGGIELGGTKTVLATGFADGRILARATLPTVAPEALVPQIAAFFATHGPVASVGVGAFGPIILSKDSPQYGHLLDTNKPGWSRFDLIGALEQACRVPVTLLTDVAAAGVGEARSGALQGFELGLYLTVGTGIGGAILLHGQPLPALLHPEIGHIALQRFAGDTAPSTCRFHASCAEGLAAGPAILARFGKPLSAYLPDSPEHALIADYLGQMCSTLVLTLSPHRIVMGGGVMQKPGLIASIRAAMIRHLGGYASIDVSADSFLCLPALSQESGIVGALHCAGQFAPALHATGPL